MVLEDANGKTVIIIMGSGEMDFAMEKESRFGEMETPIRANERRMIWMAKVCLSQKIEVRNMKGNSGRVLGQAKVYKHIRMALYVRVNG